MAEIVVPSPDPTELTTAQIMREVHHLRTLSDARIDCLIDTLRLEISKIEREFELIERGRVEQKIATQEAVTAALVAAKDAVQLQTTASGLAIAKSEAATAKSLEQLGQTFQAAIVSVNTSLADVKDRVARNEAKQSGGQQAYAGIYAFVGFVAVVASVIAAGFAFTR